jgi:hypothetical protein
VRFHYKEDNPRDMPSDIPLIGFIAQEVQPIFPEAVNQSKDGYYNFNIHPISVAMVNAVKELKAELDQKNQEFKYQLSQRDEELRILKQALCKKDPSYSFCSE